MRILHVLHQYLPDHIGGVELYTQWLTHALVQRDHEIAIFHRRSSAGQGTSRRTEDNIDIWAAWNGEFHPTRRFLSTFNNKTLLSAFRQMLAEVKPDVVHVQHLMGLPVSLLHELMARNIPYVVTLWDFWWVCANAQLLTNYDQTLCDGPRAFLNCAQCTLARANQPQFLPVLPALAIPLAQRNHILNKALSNASRLIAPAHFVRDWYVRHGIAPDNLVVVPPGMDYPANIDLSQSEEKRPFRIGYIGGLSWQKGVHLLVEAFQPLADSCELWIAGDVNFDPEYVGNLRQLANPSVKFLGKLGREAIWNMLREVDLIVVPSIWYETFCFVVSEAFVMGIPVITFDLGVLAERVRDGVDGVLVPPGDVAALRQTLQQLLQDPARWQQLKKGVRAPRRIMEHAGEMETIYREVLQEQDK